VTKKGMKEKGLTNKKRRTDKITVTEELGVREEVQRNGGGAKE